MTTHTTADEAETITLRVPRGNDIANCLLDLEGIGALLLGVAACRLNFGPTSREVAMPADAPDPVFALAQERDTIMREYSVPDLDDAIMDALEARLASVEARLAAAQCSASAAIAEKLRVVVGMEAFNDKSAERIVRSALADLERVAKAVS